MSQHCIAHTVVEAAEHSLDLSWPTFVSEAELPSRAALKRKSGDKLRFAPLLTGPHVHPLPTLESHVALQ